MGIHHLMPGHKLNNTTLINDFLAACFLLSTFLTTVCFVTFENILRINYCVELACKLASKPFASCDGWTVLKVKVNCPCACHEGPGGE